MWFWFALATAVVWGLCYAVTAYISKSFSGSAYMLLCYLIVTPLYALLCYKQTRFAEIPQLLQWPLIGWVILASLSLAAGNLLIIQAFKLAPNPFWVNVVEISFPLFTVLFSYLLFRMGYVTLASVCGFALIAGGLAIIYKFQ